MKSIFDAANALTQEIDRTRQHLVYLEQALAGLKPLMGGGDSVNMLPFSGGSFVQSVEDVAPLLGKVINAETIKVKPSSKNKQAQKSEKAQEPSQVPATGAKLWLSCIGRKKFSLPELVDSVIQKLKLDETSRVVLTNRAGAWAYGAVKKGLLTNAGARDGVKLYLRASKPATVKVEDVASAPAEIPAEAVVLAE